MSEPTPSTRARQAAGLDAPTATPGTEVSPREAKIRKVVGVVGQMESAFQLAMPTGLEAKQLIRDATTALRNVPELADCTQDSFLGALMTAAQLGLRPNVPALGHGWILPFRESSSGTTKAQWILGYQGMIELAQRTGEISSIVAHTIYANEEHEIELGLNEVLRHKPIYVEEERGDPILHYAIARFRHGGVVWHVIGEDEVERIKRRSKSSRSAYSPWNTDRDSMARKSAIIRLFKFLPKTTLLAQAIAADEEIRTDLDVEAMGKNSETTTVERIVEAPSASLAAPPTENPPAPAEAASVDDSPAPAPPEETGRRPIAASALRKGLISAVVEKYPGEVVEVIRILTGFMAETTGETAEADALAYLTADELREVLAFDFDGYKAVRAEAEAEAQLAADVPVQEIE